MTQHESFLNEEHTELLAEISEVAATPGKTGKLFSELLNIFSGHLDREEQTVLPLLGYLYDSVERPIDVSDSLFKAGKDFRTEYATMVNEHKAIDDIMKTTESDGAPEKVMELICDIRHHVMLESEVIYPAAMMAANMITSYHVKKEVAIRN
jgi:iron-sulfur cluster repair protein YtfE (RIC family)